MEMSPTTLVLSLIVFWSKIPWSSQETTSFQEEQTRILNQLLEKYDHRIIPYNNNRTGKKKKTFNHSTHPLRPHDRNKQHHRHPPQPPSNRPLTRAQKRARYSIHLISLGRAFQRRQASKEKFNKLN
ncbi:hypothetical protein J6590_048088 [Homalodisca vitripennis]|nr:hypothetical protein J6590_048088 [Homalodisca vitripennis]